MNLKHKKIIVCLTGCIAAYKMLYLIRLLKKEGAEVKVVTTQAALKFVTRLTLETLSENQIYSELFPDEGYYSTHHIALAEWADLLVIAPASGNIIGKIASGIADDLLSTVAMAAQSPIMLAPSMNTFMYENPVVQANIIKLRKLGYIFIEPVVGDLACGTHGVGRLPEPDEILGQIIAHFHRQTDLQGKSVLVTAGPTIENIDPVRYISNPSTGKMGYALAQKAYERGAQVTLISGPTHLEPPAGVALIQVKSGQEMMEMVLRHFPDTNILLMAAAVSDYYLPQPRSQKLKKSSEPMTLTLQPQVDILEKLGELKKKHIMIGFALETEHEIENAKSKLEKKNLDLIAVNNPNMKDAGFGTDTNLVTLIDKNGQVESLPLMSKLALADKIIDRILDLLPKIG